VQMVCQDSQRKLLTIKSVSGRCRPLRRALPAWGQLSVAGRRI